MAFKSRLKKQFSKIKERVGPMMGGKKKSGGGKSEVLDEVLGPKKRQAGSGVLEYTGY